MKTFDAQSIARDAALSDAEFASQVGAFVSVDYDDENRVATYLFDADIKGYRGWRWCVTVAKVDEDATPTVCDVVILPGPDSLLHPTIFRIEIASNLKIFSLVSLFQVFLKILV